MMRKLSLTLLVLYTGASFSSLFAQNPPTFSGTTVFSDAEKGYYVKDGVVHNVYVYKEKPGMQAKSMLIVGQYGHAETSFSPQEVSEYGFESGGRYISACLETGEGEQWFFLEELHKIDDNSSILYLSKEEFPQETFFLLEGNEVSQIATADDPGPMWDFFYSSSDCLKLDENIKHPSRLKKGMVRRYYKAFSDCNEKIFPRTKFGITASVGMDKPKDKRFGGSEPVDLKYDLSFSAGMFFRIPFEEVASFQGEVLYYHQSRSRGDKNHAGKFESKINTLRLPMLFRFNNNYSRKNLMPYAEIGPCFDFYFGHYEAREVSLPTFAMGVALGAGLEYYISRRQSAYLGARFSIVSNFDKGYKYNLRAFELVAGFSIF